ncbi:MAG: hypothetical protein HOQ09_12125, partial [Gemmatimonadaceae bacterium]|nr:hypothetical protein [Gemmatimonadaceae bacterium]
VTRQAAGHGATTPATTEVAERHHELCIPPAPVIADPFPIPTDTSAAAAAMARAQADADAAAKNAANATDYAACIARQ